MSVEIVVLFTESNEPTGHRLSTAVAEAGFDLALAAFSPQTHHGYVRGSYQGRECGFDFSRLRTAEIPDLPTTSASRPVAWCLAWSSSPCDALGACITAGVACAAGDGLLLDTDGEGFIDAANALEWTREAEVSWRGQLPRSGGRVGSASFRRWVSEEVDHAMRERGFAVDGMLYSRQMGAYLHQVKFEAEGGVFGVSVDASMRGLPGSLARRFFTGGSLSRQPRELPCRRAAQARSSLARFVSCLDSVVEPFLTEASSESGLAHALGPDGGLVAVDLHTRAGDRDAAAAVLRHLEDKVRSLAAVRFLPPDSVRYRPANEQVGEMRTRIQAAWERLQELDSD